MNKLTDFAVKRCKECGKEFAVITPERWAYKRTVQQSATGSRYIFWCSWGCLRANEKKEENKKMIKEQEKKKPGRKPRTEVTIETADKLPEKDLKEERGRRIAAALDKADQARQEMIDGIELLKPAALRSRVMPDALFTAKDGQMALVNEKASISLTAYEWFKLTEEILVAIRQLDVTPAEIEDL